MLQHKRGFRTVHGEIVHLTGFPVGFFHRKGEDKTLDAGVQVPNQIKQKIEYELIGIKSII